MWRRLAVLTILLGVGATLVASSGEYRRLANKEYVYATITSAGDTARVMKFTPSTGIDSFTYSDTFSYQYDTTAHKTITWTSPVQSMRLDVGYGDTTVVYACSLDCGTNIYGFEWPHPEASLTLAQVIDTLVDSINNVAGISDTVTADDSATYIKINSDFAQVELESEARWTMVVGDSLDTTTIWNTSVADACDSMVAAVNASANLDSFMTAYDSTTFYIIQSDDDGVLFYANALDTAQDTLTTADNATSTCADTGWVEVGPVYGFKTVKGEIMFKPGLVKHTGAATSCSTYLWLYTDGPAGLKVIAADSVEDLDSLRLPVTVHSNVGDTLLRNTLRLRWRYYDTLSDTTYEQRHPLEVDVTLK